MNRMKCFMMDMSLKNHENQLFFPLPLAGEGQGEGGTSEVPLTLILSPEGRGEFLGYFIGNKEASYAKEAI